MRFTRLLKARKVEYFLFVFSFSFAISAITFKTLISTSCSLRVVSSLDSFTLFASVKVSRVGQVSITVKDESSHQVTSTSHSIDSYHTTFQRSRIFLATKSFISGSLGLSALTSLAVLHDRVYLKIVDS